MQWFISALEASGGEALCLDAAWTAAANLGLLTDSSLVGYGGVFLKDNSAEYFFGRWDDFGVDVSELSINSLELATVVMALHHFGADLAQRRIIMRYQ